MADLGDVLSGAVKVPTPDAPDLDALLAQCRVDVFRPAVPNQDDHDRLIVDAIQALR